MAEYSGILDFLREMPLVLERGALRVTHAARLPSAIESLRNESRDAVSVFRYHDDRLERGSIEMGLERSAEEERVRWSELLPDESAAIPLLQNIGRLDEFVQMGNPLRVVSSGVERLGSRPFYASGKWRFVDRVEWWRHYEESVPVVFGHYWRWWAPESHGLLSNGQRSLFEGIAPRDWLPTRIGRQAMCIDYSVGARAKERRVRAGAPWRGRLAALRWPERELVFDSVD